MLLLDDASLFLNTCTRNGIQGFLSACEAITSNPCPASFTEKSKSSNMLELLKLL
ncbi:hypothetical protein KC19_VG238000 [Ceratodon purpureus]|uniref:Uncharacterized protein n=1 Tax=Ceratodon purpureus TaxID=3225 RepID=A0A8T0HTM8_CERPU|nr:hypothetical protein KC19_VG238000 [Ceratodon purpureus]